MHTVFDITVSLVFLFLVSLVIIQIMSFLSLVRDPTNIRVWFIQDPQSLLSKLLDEQGRYLRQSIKASAEDHGCEPVGESAPRRRRGTPCHMRCF
jgi:hypothetical protein